MGERETAAGTYFTNEGKSKSNCEDSGPDWNFYLWRHKHKPHVSYTHFVVCVVFVQKK
jgi:hypothetical protein